MSILLQTGGPMGSSLIFMVVIIAIFYFFMIRPQNKKQKEISNFRKTLQVNQDVVTAGGIHGVIKSIDGTIVDLQIASNVRIMIDVNSVYPKATVAADKK